MKVRELLTEAKTKIVDKGLTREEAMKQAPWKKSYGDCRGFSYNPKTGEAKWT